jgi:energy-coupling factor transport system permease protein
MQDPRLRLFAVIALSAAAFASVHGAFLAFAWWTCTLSGPVCLWRSRWPILVFLPLLVVSFALFVTGGEWASYSLRLAVVLLVATFAYLDQEPGEFLGVCTWLFGRRVGFDCGLAGEIALSALRFLEDELKKARWAFSLKGLGIGLQAIVPLSTCLLYTSLRRASDQVDLLVVRGYSGGGSLCARFRTPFRDIVVTVAAITIAFAAFAPVGEFFILIQ